MTIFSWATQTRVFAWEQVKVCEIQSLEQNQWHQFVWGWYVCALFVEARSTGKYICTEKKAVQKKKAVQAYPSATYASSENQDMILDRDRQGEN